MRCIPQGSYIPLKTRSKLYRPASERDAKHLLQGSNTRRAKPHGDEWSQSDTSSTKPCGSGDDHVVAWENPNSKAGVETRSTVHEPLPTLTPHAHWADRDDEVMDYDAESPGTSILRMN